MRARQSAAILVDVGEIGGMESVVFVLIGGHRVADPVQLREDRGLARRSFAAPSAGRRIATSRAMMATTTSNSIRVKPLLCAIGFIMPLRIKCNLIANIRKGISICKSIAIGCLHFWTGIVGLCATGRTQYGA